MNTTSNLQARGLGLGYGARQIVEGLDLAVPSGKLSVIIGANGSGKSTVVRGLGRLLAPQTGSVVLDGQSIHAMPTREVATRIGILPQSANAPEGITVAELVGRGRYPHHTWLKPWTKADDAAVSEAMALTGTANLAARPVDELSGGQRQRVWIAMALAQQTPTLLLDEPTTFLDINHQVEVLDLLADLIAGGGRTVVAVLHDLNLACRYADHLVAMKGGQKIAEGAPGDIVTQALIAHVFGLAARIVPDPVCGTPMVVPEGRQHGRG